MSRQGCDRRMNMLCVCCWMDASMLRPSDICVTWFVCNCWSHFSDADEDVSPVYQRLPTPSETLRSQNPDKHSKTLAGAVITREARDRLTNRKREH